MHEDWGSIDNGRVRLNGFRHNGHLAAGPMGGTIRRLLLRLSFNMIDLEFYEPAEPG
jgi:hypothetical protein